MPLMYRPGGVSRFFRSHGEGKAAGFYASYSDVVAACEAAQREGVQPAPVTPEGKPEPPTVASKPDDDRPKPPATESTPEPTASAGDIDDMPLAALRELAGDYGLDTSLHHMTLRKQVRELIDAQGRAG